MANRYSRMRSIARRPKVCKKPPPAPAEPRGDGILFWDTFDDDTDPDLICHIPNVDRVGEGWQNMNGTIYCRDGFTQAKPGTPIPRNVYIANMGKPQYKITCWLNTGLGASQNAGVCLWFNGTTDHIIIDLYCPPHEVRCYHRHAGYFTDFQHDYYPEIVPYTNFLLTIYRTATGAMYALDYNAPKAVNAPFPFPDNYSGIYLHDHPDIKQLEFKAVDWDDTPPPA